MRHISRSGVLLPALLLIGASGCVTKGGVVEELSRQQAEMANQQAEMRNQQAEMVQRIDQVGSETQRVNQRVDSVEGRASQAFQKAESTGVRLGTLESSVRSASEAARGARERADAAMTKAEGVEGGLTKLRSNQQNAKYNRHNTRTVETVNVQFGFDRSDLDDGAQTTLLGLVKDLQANPNLTVELVGYTDMKGAREYNYNLSQRRVDAVRRFLVEKGVQTSRIQAVSLGALGDRGVPEAQKRRVSARLMIEQD
jgi:outer membrane protein OmpA-like peptidoglycan-associated protein